MFRKQLAILIPILFVGLALRPQPALANPAPPAGYQFCAWEGEHCAFGGTADVAYGAEGRFNYRSAVSGGVQCINEVFGDPNPGVRKACFIRPAVATPPAGYEFCAWEGEHCGFGGTADVAYGANGRFAHRSAISGGVHCVNEVFGDPNPGVRKACFIRPAAARPTPTPWPQPIPTQQLQPPQSRPPITGLPTDDNIALYGSEWLGGKGVHVYYIGGKSGRCPYPGEALGTTSARSENYQCFDLAVRLYYAVGYDNFKIGNSLIVRAIDLRRVDEISNKPAGEDLQLHRNGEATKPPAPGDLLLFDDGSYGHVAVISRVTSTRVVYVQQNVCPDGKPVWIETAPLIKSGNKYSIGRNKLRVYPFGWVSSKLMQQWLKRK